MLYSEEVRGFPVQKVVNLRCEFFGLAGHYALRLKPLDSGAPTTSAYIKVSNATFLIISGLKWSQEEKKKEGGKGSCTHIYLVLLYVEINIKKTAEKK